MSVHDWITNIDREAIVKEINESIATILTKHGLPYSPKEITLNYLQKTDDPWFSALGILNAPGVKVALTEIKELLSQFIAGLSHLGEIHGEILARIIEIEGLAPKEAELLEKTEGE